MSVCVRCVSTYSLREISCRIFLKYVGVFTITTVSELNVIETPDFWKIVVKYLTHSYMCR